jgi:transcriptional regulator with XRE-family HTH domain
MFSSQDGAGLQRGSNATLGKMGGDWHASGMTAPDSSRTDPDLQDRVDRADRHVSARVRERRIAQGLSLQDLAAALGITNQRLHKYETGASRISAGRLVEIARALQTPPGWFFHQLADPPSGPFPRRLYDLMWTFEELPDRSRKLLLQFSRDLAIRATEGKSELAPGRSCLAEDEPTPDGSDAT